MKHVVPIALLYGVVMLTACDDSRSIVQPPSSPPPASPTPPPTPPASTDPVSGLGARYVVTFTAADSCTDIPAELRQRTYQASVRPADARTDTLALTGADFYEFYNEFWAFALQKGSARLLISSWYAVMAWMEDQPIFERVAGGAYVSILGSTQMLTIPSGAIDAAFDGSFTYCAAAGPPGAPSWPPTCPAPVVCRSTQHKLTMVPVNN